MILVAMVVLTAVGGCSSGDEGSRDQITAIEPTNATVTVLPDGLEDDWEATSDSGAATEQAAALVIAETATPTAQAATGADDGDEDSIAAAGVSTSATQRVPNSPKSISITEAVAIQDTVVSGRSPTPEPDSGTDEKPDEQVSVGTTITIVVRDPDGGLVSETEIHD